jgi:hypothetical protein
VIISNYQNSLRHSLSEISTYTHIKYIAETLCAYPSHQLIQFVLISMAQTHTQEVQSKNSPLSTATATAEEEREIYNEFILNETEAHAALY